MSHLPPPPQGPPPSWRPPASGPPPYGPPSYGAPAGPPSYGPPSYGPPGGPPAGPPYGAPYGQPSYGPPAGPPKRSRTGLVVALAVVAVLLVGAAGTGFVLWQERDDDPAPSAGGDPTTSPTDDPSSATAETIEPQPTEPTEPSSEAPTDPGSGDGDGLPVDPAPSRPSEPEPTVGPLSDSPLSYREFEGDWDFALDGVELQAAYEDGVDHGDCGPAEREGALTDLGCVAASEWTYRALRGDLALSHLVLTMRSPRAAAEAVEDSLITEESWKLRPASYLAGNPGAWRANDVGQFVVITVVTHRPSVAQAKADRYLSYANTDIAGALAFRF